MTAPQISTVSRLPDSFDDSFDSFTFRALRCVAVAERRVVNEWDYASSLAFCLSSGRLQKKQLDQR